MSERGVFAVDRGIFDHPVFAREAFTEREAWQWLIAEAAWKPHRRRIGTFQVDLIRGQLAASIRFLAERWDWHRSRVDRFLARLKTETMIETANETGITVITICNYGKYQRVSLPTETETELPLETGSRQERDKEEGKEGKEPFSFSPDNHARERDDWPANFEDEFWRAYPHKVGKAAALKSLATIRKRRLVTWAVLMNGLHRYAAKTDDRPWCNPATWLNQQRWSDQPATSQMARAGPPRVRGFADLLSSLPPPDQAHEPTSNEQKYDLDLTASRS